MVMKFEDLSTGPEPVRLITGEIILAAQEACRKFNASCEPCGSRVTQRAPVGEESDYDFLVHLPSTVVDPFDRQVKSSDDLLVSFMGALAEAGFEWEGSTEHYQSLAASSFMSYRQGKVNLIVTTNSAFAMRHRAATHVCRELGHLDKEHRKMVFQAVLYGSHYDPLTKAVMAMPANYLG